MDNLPPGIMGQQSLIGQDIVRREAEAKLSELVKMADKASSLSAFRSSPTSRSEDIKLLAAALSKTQSMLKFAVKDATNPHFKNKYADLASVWEACREALAANQLAITQLPSADGMKVTLTTILMHNSGQFISSDLTMTAAQNTPQAIGSVITYARRYALSSLVGIAQDDDDGNAGSRSVK